MNTMSLNAEILRELSYIADDETRLKKALNYVRRLVSQQKEEEMQSASKVAEEGEAYRPLTKAELVAELKEMCDEVKLIRAGKVKGESWEDFVHEIHN